MEKETGRGELRESWTESQASSQRHDVNVTAFQVVAGMTLPLCWSTARQAQEAVALQALGHN